MSSCGAFLLNSISSERADKNGVLASLNGKTSHQIMMKLHKLDFTWRASLGYNLVSVYGFSILAYYSCNVDI